MKVAGAPQHENKTKENFKFVTVGWQLKALTLTWKYAHCTVQIGYMCASEFPLKNFCKVAKQAETARIYQKQILVMTKHCLRNLQLNSI